MSDKYHVNPTTGNPNKCTATKSCPFGGDDKHYFSKEAAHAAFEKDQGPQVKSFSKPSKLLKDLPPLAKDLPDLPDGRSFAQAWTDKFQELADFKTKNGDTPVRSLIPEPDSLLSQKVYAIRDRGQSLMTKDQYAADGGYFPDGVTGDYVVCVATRQGGGNRECWCDDSENHDSTCLSVNNEQLVDHPDYLSDRDDEFDSTYANFYYSAGITQKQVDEYEAKVRNMRRLALDELTLEGAKSGELTPWAALAGDYDAGQKYRGLKLRLSTQEKAAKAAEESNAQIDAGLKKVYSGKINETEAAQMGANRYRLATLVRESKNLVAAQKKLDAVMEIQKSAEALPDDHPLRQWAIGARDERTYQTTEKKGRRNVTVTKKYTPKPRLMDDIESEQRGVDNAKRSIDSMLTDVVTKKESNDRAIKAFAESKEAIADSRQAAWEEGWYGDPREIPKIPEDF